MRRTPRYERGYTLQELLVVLLVGSIIVSYTLSLLLSVLRVLTRAESTLELRDAVNGSAQAIALDVQKSISVSAVGDSVLLLSLPGDRTIEYRLVRGRLMRSSEPMIPDSVITLRLRVGVSQPPGAMGGAGNQVDISIWGKSRGVAYETTARVATVSEGREAFETVARSTRDLSRYFRQSNR